MTPKTKETVAMKERRVRRLENSKKERKATTNGPRVGGQRTKSFRAFLMAVVLPQLLLAFKYGSSYVLIGEGERFSCALQ